MIAKSVLRAQARWGSALALSVACLIAVLTTRANADVVDYQYDELGRLRTVIQDDGRVTSYTLDSAGNRTNVVTAVASIIEFSTPTFSVGEAGVTATITAKRTGSLTGVVGVTYATANGTATAGSDYTATTNTLSWGNGDPVDKTFTVTIANDTTQEPSESIRLTLRSPTGTAVLGAQSTATLTIVEALRCRVRQFATRRDGMRHHATRGKPI